MDRAGDGLAQWDGNGIADLCGDLSLRPAPAEPEGKPLNASSLEVSDRPVLLRMEVATLLGFVELRSDGDGRLPEAQSSHDVAGARVVAVPALGRKGFDGGPHSRGSRGQEDVYFAGLVDRVPLATQVLAVSPSGIAR